MMRNKSVRLIAVGAIVLVTSAAVLHYYPNAMPEAGLGLGLAGFFFLLNRLINRQILMTVTDRFYRLLLGGMAVRFLFFIAVLFLIKNIKSLSLAEFVLFFVLYYLLLQAAEIQSIYQRLKQRSHAE